MRHERGMALVIALLVVAAAALLALTMADRGLRVARDTVVDRVSATAQAAAAGGVDRARWALAQDPDYDGETLEIGNCSVSIAVVNAGRKRSVAISASTGSAPFAETVTRRVDAELLLRDAALPRITAWRE
jgi:Tfp pilus assembly protein PilX